MKIFWLVLGAVWLAVGGASAQLSVSLSLDQPEFLPGEQLPVAVRIVNRSGQTLHLGADADWLVFSVESADGFVVVKDGDVPVAGAFDLSSSEEATKRVDLQPYFRLTRPGRYKVSATVRIKDWNAQVTSQLQIVDVINGVQLWSVDFGVPPHAGVTNGPPEMRKYVLQEANSVRSQMRLYVRVSDASGSQVFKVFSIGRMVSFSQPVEQLDKVSDLHVLWQNGASTFAYVVVDPDGKLLKQEIYDYVTTRPRLDVNASGDVVMVGGVLRVSPEETAEEMPLLKPAPAPAKP